MSAQHQLAFDVAPAAAPPPAPPALERDDGAPRISAEEESAVAEWCATHPPHPHVGPGQAHARWVWFLAAHRLAAMRDRASGGAPPLDFDPDGA